MPGCVDPCQAAQLHLRGELTAARQLGLSINSSRDAIGAAKGRIEAARVARAIATISSEGGGGNGGGGNGGGGGAAEAAEAAAAAELHAGKQRYTAQAAELKRRKQHCAALQARYKAQQEERVVKSKLGSRQPTQPPTALEAEAEAEAEGRPFAWACQEERALAA